ncbi:MULE transposase domain-containing protein [Hirsutella rhossiliensis]|uniref:MULE transposase domain-containing protein n=1 Tax=Hirsutella rhossiliensis TaxID=111463 RepID=A0A9P8SH06_9HYPO|nr:MULE transposase domain-containing protein [Hirsutella rhossiliensis]KAH0962613.1 MULE transposase domain-containing protein [Hirsutella rhossiliensis]
MDNTYKVNRFNMPLLQIIGTTGLHKSFSVGFGLTAKEDEGAFQWILSQLREAGRQADIPDPGVVITDFDTALKNALDSIFPSTQQQVCVWHMMKNISGLLSTQLTRSVGSTLYRVFGSASSR